MLPSARPRILKKALPLFWRSANRSGETARIEAMRRISLLAFVVCVLAGLRLGALDCGTSPTVSAKNSSLIQKPTSASARQSRLKQRKKPPSSTGASGCITAPPSVDRGVFEALSRLRSLPPELFVSTERPPVLGQHPQR